MATTSRPRLGELERAVMEHLWQHTGPGDDGLTVREVHDAVGLDRGLAYTTVMTVLDRLAKKDLVRRERDGRAWRYLPRATRDELTAESLRDTLDALSGADRRAALLHFLDDSTPAQLDELKSALAEVEARAARG